MVNLVLVAAGSIGLAYLLRKFREYQWGWVRSTGSLKDKLYIVTGANSGIGLEATKALVSRQATVIMACRNMKKAGEAIKTIREEVVDGDLIPLELDLASFDSIQTFVDVIRTQYPYFDCLINNAGVRVLIAAKQTSNENFEIHAGVNHLGTFLLTRLLDPQIRKNKARIVIVASQMHEMATLHVDDFEVLHEPKGLLKSFDAFNALYDNSKLMNVYFARELYKRGYDVHVICPGLCATEIFHKSQRMLNLLVFWPFILLFMKSAQQGAQNIIYAATENVNTQERNPGSGFYIKDVQLTKSRARFSEELSEKLWQRSSDLCRI
jgi:NAD(P)-dependent dehydrogenase (short-subunit alcohol dehydrogenase family)